MRRIGPYGFSLTVNAYLQNHPAPKIVVLCVNAVLFESDPTTLDGEIQQRLAWFYGPQVGSTWERIPLVSKRGAVRVIDFWSPDIRSRSLIGLESETYYSLDAKSRAARGFFSLPREHGPPRGIPVGDDVPLKAVREEWNDGVCVIADNCREHGTKFAILFAPLSDAFRNARDWSKLGRWAHAFEASHAGTAVTSPIFYPDAIMWDAIHLNRAGVEKFVPTVAKDVQAVLGK